MILMEGCPRSSFHDSNLASRKAEEAAWRRFQAARWLDSMVGPLGLSPRPSEQDFLACLRNGLILCNTINKVQPGSVPKVVENHCSLQNSEAPPLTAYQYFENIRNFLVAVEELRLPVFEASDLERDTMEPGSTVKIVDCILALKSYHDWKLSGGSGNGPWKYARSPLVSYASNKIQSRVGASSAVNACRHLDMSTADSDKQLLAETGKQKLNSSNDLVDALVKVVADCFMDRKENIDQSITRGFANGDTEAFTKFISSCLLEGKMKACPDPKLILKDLVVEKKISSSASVSRTPEDSSTTNPNKSCNSVLTKCNCERRLLLEAQEKDLMELKVLQLGTKKEFEALKLQLQRDLMQLETEVQGLSTAALGYQQVVVENRSLFNDLQDLKGNIRVYCRIRPAFDAEIRSTIEFIGDDGSLVIVDPLKAPKDSSKPFQFDRVFGPSTIQEEVFKDIEPLIRSVMDGYNVCIFAYGQTGSGKTYTMCGPQNGSLKEFGINYMALNGLFRLACDRKDLVKYVVRVQMVEIYNEQVRDLLSADTTIKRLEIRTCTGSDGLSLPEANMHLVCSTKDVLNLMKLGDMNRAVSSTAVNDRSSRSHSILTVRVEGKDTSGNTLRSCLHLVDLAGSERLDKSEVTGERLKEAQHINKSLACLGDVITALAQKNPHIPYRNSKLTQLLQDSLGGQAKTLMFAHVSPEADSYGETISTLKFAQRVSTVKLGAARLNKENCDVLKLKEQVDKLNKELAKKDGETTKTREVRTALDIMKQKTELTPPRSRRLSIESQSIGKTQPAMKQSSKPVKSPVRNGRRLSLEGGKSEQKGVRSQSTDVNNNNGMTTVERYFSNDRPSDVIVPSIEASCQLTRSPRSAANRMRNPVRPPKSPEPLKLANRSQIPKSPEPPTVANRSHMPSYSTTAKKGSQIKKSLLTIGKFINGSEKRNQNELKASPTLLHCKIYEAKSPLTANAKLVRRQSLTGVPMDASRRASLGGKQSDSYSSGERNARTPPPLHHSSSKAAKRWL